MSLQTMDSILSLSAAAYAKIKPPSFLRSFYKEIYVNSRLYTIHIINTVYHLLCEKSINRCYKIYMLLLEFL